MADLNYWAKRNKALQKTMEESEADLKKRLADYYAEEAARLDDNIAAYYAKYGEGNVIEYNRLMEILPESDRQRMIRDVEGFVKEHPEYSHLVPVRESIYKLNRLQGLQLSTLVQQMEIGVVEHSMIEKHLAKIAVLSANNAVEALGIGGSFYTESSSIIKAMVNKPWSKADFFSASVWDETLEGRIAGNRVKLANYLNTDIAQGFARGDSYRTLTNNILDRFGNVSRRDAYRLIYTEGTYVSNEASMQEFAKYYQRYTISPIHDAKTCEICRGMEEQSKADPFLIKDRVPGTNFPPFHPWCRCSYVIADVEETGVQIGEHGGEQAEADKIKKNLETPGNSFVPAKTIEEAEEYARQFVDDTQWAAAGLSYKGISVETANIVNEALTAFYRQFDVEKLGGIVAPAGNTKMGKLVEGSTAAYSPTRNSLFLNRKSMKNIKAINETLASDREALIGLTEHPERYNWDKISSRAKRLVENSRLSGRSAVPETPLDVINHELGHRIEKTLKADKELIAKAVSGREEWGPKISGYACDSDGEYIAESFSLYMKGGEIDPQLRKIFDSLRKE